LVESLDEMKVGLKVAQKGKWMVWKRVVRLVTQMGQQKVER